VILRRVAIASFLAIAATVLALAFSPGAAIAQLDGIDNNDRAEVARTYLAAVEAAKDITPAWSGSVNGCVAGEVSPAFTSATLGSINWFRAMAGVAPIVESPAATNRAQQAALMMHAQNSLSHTPSPSWACFSAAGAESAGRANLTLGVTGALGVTGQMKDPGAANTALGHRRWLLFPALAEVGVGSTSSAGVVEVIGDFGTARSALPWVAWPPEGYVPHDVVFERWSISRERADFSNASVSMTLNGRAIPVTLLPLANGFGQPTLGWEVNDLPTGSADATYVVSVANVVVDGQTLTESYTVRSFDPTVVASSAAKTVTSPATTYFCRGQRATIIGTAGADVIRGTSGDDVIVGLSGADRISGLGGDDIICGGGGADTLNGGSGSDVLVGNAGNDTLLGKQGLDSLVGGGGQDHLEGGAGADTLTGGAQVDVLIGDGGADRCWGLRADVASQLAERYVECESTR